MKLRYYLRGIGIGIIVAAALCICGTLRSSKMSDEQIKKRAAELGMTESGAVLSDIAQATTEETVVPEIETIAAPAVEETPSALEVSSEEDTISEPQEEESTIAKEEEETVEAPKPSEEEKPEESVEAPKEEPKEEEVEAPAPATGDNITFVVEKGAGSDTVARKLASLGLISDAAAYDKWLCQKGYDRRISAGTHIIPKNATQEQIAVILTGGN